jgi:hypothetical protein
MARLVLSAAAGIAVGYFLGPQAGFATFAAVYGATAPPTKVVGPRLDDLKAPKASFGTAIPIIEGALRTAGIFAWYSDKREIATTQEQGKGGGVESTTFTYEMDARIILSGNECTGVRRIFSYGKLIWSNGDDADLETISASANVTAWRAMRFYSGADDQLPDPIEEAALGVGNVPGYRGRSSVFIEGLNLGSNGQIPILTFEVLSEGDSSAVAATFADVPSASGIVGQGSCAFSPAGFQVHVGQWDSSYANATVIVYDVARDGEVTEAGTYTASANAASCHGQTDVAGIMSTYGYLFGSGDLLDLLWNEGPTGIAYRWRLPENLGQGGGVRFCMRGDQLIVASSFFGSGKVYRFSKADGAGLAGGAPLVTSAPQGTYFDDVVSDGTTVYCYVSGSTTLKVLDAATLSVSSTLALPAGVLASSGAAALLIDEEGLLYYIVDQGADIWVWDGSVWTNAFPNVAPSFPRAGAQYGVADGVVFAMSGSGVSGLQRVHVFYQTLATAQVPLDQVVSRICLRTGLEAGDIDVTDLASDNVRGIALTGTARQAIEQLMAGYLFEAVEAETIRFVKRGGSAAATIVYADLGASAGEPVEPLPLRRLNDIELPAKLTVKYANVLDDYQDGAESGDRLVTSSEVEQLVEVAVVFTPSEARRLVDANTMDLAVSVQQIGPVALGRKHSLLQPTDVIVLTGSDGSTFRARIGKSDVADGVTTHQLVLDDATAINSVVDTDEGYTASTLVRLTSRTELELLDIPILRDADNTPGFYAAFGGGDVWPGAELDKSSDNITFERVTTAIDQAVMGTASTTLGDWTGGNVFDEVNVLTVDVGDGTLSSVSRATLLNSASNALLVGSEIIQFKTASMLSAGVYTLSGLLRGRRGTEWASTGHAADERVVLLQTTGLRRVQDQAADIGISRYWKGVTLGASPSGVTAQQFTDTGVGLKPFAPTSFHIADGPAGKTISWLRRSRLSGTFLPTIAVELGEDTESYDVELYNGSDTLVDSATVDEPEYTTTGFVRVDTIDVAVFGMRTLGGNRYAVQTQIPGTQDRLVKLDADGAVVETTTALGQVVAIADNGTSIYLVVNEILENPPLAPTVTATKVYKFTPGSFAAADATYTATTNDTIGVAHDGTNVWISHPGAALIRKLNASTLASVATYSIAGGPFAIAYRSGVLWIGCRDSSHVSKFDIGTLTELARYASGVLQLTDLLVNASIVVAQGYNAAAALDVSTGAVLHTHSYFNGGYGAPQRYLLAFGSYFVFFINTAGVNPRIALDFIDSTTGALAFTLAWPRNDMEADGTVHYLAGTSGSDLVLTGFITGLGWVSKVYSLSPDLAGYRLVVYQKSATVGRGYPAELEL